ncbi:helix-turn-helix domain-containing protein [Stappia sp.]|uniref:helix-turn-helix domain-containing protein n=1 Tax=Stappia sp. TaxID=1870903 RepID=UPI003D0CB479
MYIARAAFPEQNVPMDAFCRNLKKRAEDLGIANAEVARRSGLSERRYAHYVSGDREPDLATLVRIANALGATPNQLLGLDEIPRASPRDLLVQRVQSAAQGVSNEALEMIAIQIEALAAKRV